MEKGGKHEMRRGRKKEPDGTGGRGRESDREERIRVRQGDARIGRMEGKGESRSKEMRRSRCRERGK